MQKRNTSDKNIQQDVSLMVITFFAV